MKFSEWMSKSSYQVERYYSRYLRRLFFLSDFYFDIFSLIILDIKHNIVSVTELLYVSMFFTHFMVQKQFKAF